MTLDLVDAPATAIPRDRYKRPLVVPPEGGKPTAYTRCTTFVDCLDDKYNLQLWQQRMVALGLAARPDLLLAVATTDRDDKETLNSLTEQAQEAAQAHAAATTGTALHRFTERHDRGQQLGALPAAYRPDLDAYIAATAELTPVLIEQFTVNDELKIGGTPDRVVTYGGRGYIADLKTGSIDYAYATMAMQLAVYAHSQPYHHVTGAREPYPVEVDFDRGIIIHLPAGEGRCALYWLDLHTGWEGVQLAAEVRKWRRRKNLLTRWESTVVDQPVDTVDVDREYKVGDTVTVAGVTFTKHAELPDAYDSHRIDALDMALELLAAAPTLDELRAIYTRLVETGVAANAILPTCLARKAILEGGTA